jgi:hypothetical protein
MWRCNTGMGSFGREVRLEEGQPQVPAAGLAIELRLFADGGCPPAATAEDLEGVGAAQVESVLAVFPREGVDGLVKLPDLLRLQGILEEGVLDPGILDEVQKDHAGRAVEVVAPDHLVEQAAEEAGQLQGMDRGAIELGFAARRVEILPFQKGGDPPGGEAVASGLDAGRLQVPHQVGEKIVPVGRRRGEGLRFADRDVDALLLRGNGEDQFPTELLPCLDLWLREPLPDRLFGQPGEFQSGFYTHFIQIVCRGGADPPDPLHGQPLQIGGDRPSGDDGEAGGLSVFGGHLGQDLGDAEPGGDSDFQLPGDLRLDLQGNGLVGGPERPPHSGEVGEGLVDGVLLHLGGEAADDVEHPTGEEAVGLVVGGEDDELRTDPFRLAEGDAPFDPQPLGRIARAGDDPPFAPGDDRLSPEFRMESLLAGGEEGVPVDMEDRLRPAVKAEDDVIHGRSLCPSHEN